jgi:hypothetical protein
MGSNITKLHIKRPSIIANLRIGSRKTAISQSLIYAKLHIKRPHIIRAICTYIIIHWSWRETQRSLLSSEICCWRIGTFCDSVSRSWTRLRLEAKSFRVACNSRTKLCLKKKNKFELLHAPPLLHSSKTIYYNLHTQNIVNLKIIREPS